MRSIAGLYFVIGIVLLGIGFLVTGPCTTPNRDILDDVVFVLTWPVSLYSKVLQGPLTTQGWLHAQACEGGMHGLKPDTIVH